MNSKHNGRRFTLGTIPKMTGAHNVRSWNIIQPMVESESRLFEDLAQAVTGHIHGDQSKDQNDPAPFVAYCIKMKWLVAAA